MCIFAVTFILAKTQFISLSSKNSDALQLFHKLSLDQATVYYPKNNDRCSPEIPFQRCTVRQMSIERSQANRFMCIAFLSQLSRKIILGLISFWDRSFWEKCAAFVYT